MTPPGGVAEGVDVDERTAARDASIESSHLVVPTARGPRGGDVVPATVANYEARVVDAIGAIHPRAQACEGRDCRWAQARCQSRGRRCDARLARRRTQRRRLSGRVM